MRAFPIITCAAIALLVQTGAALAQTNPCPRSNDPANFDNEFYNCGADPEPGVRPPDDPQPTIDVSPHQQDYSHFYTTSMTTFFNSLDDEQKKRVVQAAARYGISTDGNRPMSVEEFGSLTQFMDDQMNRYGATDRAKRQLLGQIAADAGVYKADPSVGQDFGDASGARTNYEDAPKR